MVEADVLARASELRALIAEYGRLARLESGTPQSRGQRFNTFIAEVLRCWAIDASAEINAAGNVDVAFSLGDTRFILEAKWEETRADTGSISKLQKRVRQRLGGTLGLFLSMSGFTEDALRDVKQGERLEVLLLDRDHFEAMLTGFYPPRELLNVQLDRASFYGEPHTPLLRSIESRHLAIDEISFDVPRTLNDIIRVAEPGFCCRVVLSNLPPEQSGVVEKEPDVLLLTLSGGLVEVDLESRTARPVLRVAGCARNAHVGQDGSLYFVRRNGIACLQGERIALIAGGLTGNVALVHGHDKELWAFCNSSTGNATDPSAGALLVRCGQLLGEQTEWRVAYLNSSGTNAAWIRDETFLVVGNAGARISELSGVATRVQFDAPNPMGIMRTGDDRFVIAAGDVSLIELDIAKGELTEVAALNLQGSVSELAPARRGGGRGYLASHYADEAGETKGVVTQFARG
jgi:hypothetical protein